MAQRQATVQTKPSNDSTRQKPKTPKARPAPSKAARKKAASPAKPAETSKPHYPSAAVPRPKGKLGQLLALIECAHGATLEELTARLNWQPHSARAAITGLRKRGFEIALTTEDDRKAYRIVV